MTEKKLERGDFLQLELDGKVFLVHRDKEDKILSKEEIDAELVLKVLLSAIEESLQKA